jgi:arylsulfatase A-like enzyme
VLTSDHGEEFLDHGQFEHGHAFYQEVARIPLVIAAPNAPRSGRAVEGSPVGLVDIGATLLEHAGLGSHPLPGQRLGGAVEIRPYLSRNLLYGGAPDDRFAVRRGPWKAIFGPDGAAELYDLTRDPGETVDRARTPGDRREPEEAVQRAAHRGFEAGGALRGRAARPARPRLRGVEARVGAAASRARRPPLAPLAVELELAGLRAHACSASASRSRF